MAQRTLKENRTVKSELATISPERHAEIRSLYYKLAESLKPLAHELEMADLDTGGEAGPLLDQHFIICEMMDSFRRVELGIHL